MIITLFKKRELLATALIITLIVTILNNYTVFAARVDKNPPTAPKNLSASQITDIGVVLSWGASSDNVGVTSYSVLMNDKVIGNTPNTTYQVRDLLPSNSYRFQVVANDAAGNVSKPSNTINITTLDAQLTEPVSTPAPIPTNEPVPTVEPEPIIEPEPTVVPPSKTEPEPTTVPSPTTPAQPTEPAPTTAPTITPTTAPTTTPTTTPEPTTSPTAPTPATEPEPTTSPTTPTPTTAPEPTVEPTPTTTPAPTPKPVVSSPIATRVVGYYAAWSAYSGFTPDKIDGSKLTHINYSFANIGSDLKIALGYPDIDPANFKRLNDLKAKHPHLKTLIAVGGWTWSGRFSDVALTNTSRNTFADSVVEFIVNHGFDGVDIDWEYPVSGGLATNVRRPEDKQNFTLLMKTLREKLDARGLVDNKEYILTFAGAAGTWYINNIELSKLSQYVDYANIMTYDINGTWDKFTDFNAPLYTNKDASPQFKWSVDSSINAWLNAGFPKSKLVMGVPFYGYRYNNVTNANEGLYQTYSGGSSISYANIVNNYLNAPGYVRYYHEESMVPWLFNGSTFISYEDEQSMRLKAEYIKSKGLGGAMIWELSHDPNRVLLNALFNGLK